MDLDKFRLVSIIGDIDSGKTNLGVYLLRQYKGNRSIHVLGYPKVIDNFNILNSHRDLTKLTNSVIFIDEFSRFFPLKSRCTNNDFMNIARVLSHNNNTMIFTTQLSQDLTVSMESFVDVFCMTTINDLRTLKKDSRAKNAVLDCADIRRTSYGFNLVKGEYYEFSDKNSVGHNGVKTFPFQDIGKDWKNKVSVSVDIQTIDDKENDNSIKQQQSLNRKYNIKL
jgi:hypothetical protein